MRVFCSGLAFFVFVGTLLAQYPVVSEWKKGDLVLLSVWRGKVQQILKKDYMVVGMKHGENFQGPYHLVLMKIPTEGLSDGKMIQPGEWKDIADDTTYVVTGTKQLKTTKGGTRTLLLIEPKSAEKK